MDDFIRIRGAREHNLRSIDLDLPRNRLVVITGLSGSGKSSLAFDTIYADGQRRYVESLSAYARQFLELMQKPDVEFDHRPVARDRDRAEDHLQEPALDGRHGHRDLRLPAPAVRPHRHPLLARDRPADREPDRLADGRPDHGAARGHAALPAEPDRARPQGRVPEGVGRAAAGGLPAGQDRRQAVRARRGARSSTRSSSTTSSWWSTAWCWRRGSSSASPRASRPRSPAPTACCSSRTPTPASRLLLSAKFACPVSGFTIEEIEPRLFSFNNPHGACPACDGLGRRLYMDPALVVPDPEKSLYDGAIEPWSQSTSTYYLQALDGIAKHFRASLHTPWQELPEAMQRADPRRLGRRAGRAQLRRRAPALRHQAAVRGRAAQPAAALARDRERLAQGRARPLSVERALRGLRRPPPQARGARGQGRRAATSAR